MCNSHKKVSNSAVSPHVFGWNSKIKLRPGSKVWVVMNQLPVYSYYRSYLTRVISEQINTSKGFHESRSVCEISETNTKLWYILMYCINLLFVIFVSRKHLIPANKEKALDAWSLCVECLLVIFGHGWLWKRIWAQWAGSGYPHAGQVTL